MVPMNFSQLICELEQSDLSHTEIADLVGTVKSNVSHIKTRGTVPNYFLGEKLIKLHASRCPQSDLLKAKVS
jgi:predicted XRE-type DNA-binding protein